MQAAGEQAALCGPACWGRDGSGAPWRAHAAGPARPGAGAGPIREQLLLLTLALLGGVGAGKRQRCIVGVPPPTALTPSPSFRPGLSRLHHSQSLHTHLGPGLAAAPAGAWAAGGAPSWPPAAHRGGGCRCQPLPPASDRPPRCCWHQPWVMATGAPLPMIQGCRHSPQISLSPLQSLGQPRRLKAMKTSKGGDCAASLRQPGVNFLFDRQQSFASVCVHLYFTHPPSRTLQATQHSLCTCCAAHSQCSPDAERLQPQACKAAAGPQQPWTTPLVARDPCPRYPGQSQKAAC